MLNISLIIPLNYCSILCVIKIYNPKKEIENKP